MNSFINLSGKAAVVIGGAGYLGRTICEALAQYRASLTIASRDKERCCSLADKISATTIR